MNELVPADHLLRVGTVDLAAQTLGDATDPAVLLIAGAACSMQLWDGGLCDRLAAAGRYVVRYDHRDTGGSTTVAVGAPDYDLGDLAADALGLLDALGIQQAHLVGLSMGSALCQLIALGHPERVLTLTLCSSTPGDMGAEAPDLPPLGFASDDDEANGDHGDDPGDEDDDLGAASNHFILGPSPRWRHRLGEITAPTLVAHGREDTFFRLPHGEALAREIAGAEFLVLEGAGHQPPPAVLAGVFADAVIRHTATAGS